MPGAAVRVGGHTIRISNPEKVLYPGGHFNKSNVIEYYSRVAPALLPHFRNRPVTLVRFPDGVFGESFFEKNAPGFSPAWIKTFPVERSGGGVIRYILINDKATLLWAANLAALELHPFLHRIPDIRHPSYIVFDLDPGEGADILSCAQVALLVRDLLAKLNLRAFAKVSGSKGLQVYVPLNRPVTYELVQPFARTVAELLSRRHPDEVVADMSKTLRANKVFIDWSQNIVSKTTVGVYSLRAKHAQPFVSMPVEWLELKRALRAREPRLLYFSPAAAVERIKKQGDLFSPVLRLKQDLPKAFTESLSVKAPRASKSLQVYGAKRNFAKTGEPEPMLPARSAQGSRRRFVVQKHAAQQLHYDFRLEIGDVLKSWAVPKGIPLVTGEQRSAFETEDHPLDYLEFEGVIPRGQYGAGTVMVWDIGTYDRVAGNFYHGELTIFLNGRKLKGGWRLKKLQGAPGQERKSVWLLTRTGGSVKRMANKRLDESALTGRTSEQIANDRDRIWQSERPGRAPSRIPKRKANRRRFPAPSFESPMKATLVDKLPEGPQWIYEIKWDGYRALALKHGESVRLLSRKGKNLASDFPSVERAILELASDTTLMDGEIVAVNGRGRPSFQALQNRASLTSEWQVVYYAFDLLNLEGEDLKRLPLQERKARLQRLLAGTSVRFNADLRAAPGELIAEIKKAGLEGIVAKRKDSLYQPRTRSSDWLKLKVSYSQEFVIGGYKPAGHLLASLLVGYYDGARFLFAGKVRQGLTPFLRSSLLKRFAALRQKRCPFANLPVSRSGHFGEGVTKEEMAALRWTSPKLVAQVSFTEWTTYGLLRHATFIGLRDDKPAREVVREVPQHVS